MKPLILLHGALGTEKTFDKLVSTISDRDVHVLTFSGHGSRNFYGELSFDLFVEDILNYMDDNNLETADFFGYSMGGYAALCLSLVEPKRVNRILTLGTKFEWTAETAAQEIRKLDPDKIEEKVPQFATHLKNLHGPHWKNLMNQTADMMKELGDGKALSSDEFKRIQSKVVLSRGEMDDMVTKEETARTAEQIPNGQHVELPGVYHVFEKNDVADIAGVIGEYL